MRALFVQFQHLDQQLAHQAQARDAALAALSERDALRVLKATVAGLVTQLKQERAKSSELQWALEEVEVLLHALHDQEQDGPNDPLAARELAQLQKQRAQLEEQALQQLEYIAELDQTLAHTERRYHARQAAWTQHEPVVQEQADQLTQTIEALQSARERVAQHLPTAMHTLYDDLQRRHRGSAFAAITNRQCSVCHARLPAAVFDMLADLDALVRCPRCGRVVYLEEVER